MARLTKILTTTLTTMMVTVLVAVLAAPAMAATVTYTTTFVDGRGNTITISTTYVDGVLTTQESRTVMPDGTLKTLKTWEYYPNRTIKTYDEWNYSPVAPTHFYREYADTGVLLFQKAEMWLNGELSTQVLTSYDITGTKVSEETRLLTTLADGTKVWNVTVTTYEGGVLVSTITKQYPYGYDFDAPEEAKEERPGWGYGDENHEHTGPAGNGADVNAGNGGTDDADDSIESRPGIGHGDENHEHMGKD